MRTATAEQRLAPAREGGIPALWENFGLAKRWSSLHSYFFLTAVTLLCIVPLSGRAFHVDDTLFVWTAQHVAQDPTNPYGFQIIWDQTRAPMSDVTQNPPLASYYAALIGRLLGWSERALHLGFLLVAIALVRGTYRLARRFTRSPLLAALSTLLTPGVLVSASSVMCDTMMLAIWVWAAIFWIEGLESRRTGLLIASSVLIAASALTKYFGASLLLLLLAYSIARRRRPEKYALFLLIPVAILCAYQFWTAGLYGHGLLAGAAEFAGAQRAAARGSFLAMAIVALSYTGGCSLLGLTFAPFVWSRAQLAMGAVVSAIASLAIAAGWLDLGLQLGDVANRSQLLIDCQLFLWTAGGISVLALALKDWWEEKDADSLFLILWTLGTFVFAAFVNYTVNARSILPLIPAGGILLARRFDKTYGEFPSRAPGPVLAVNVALVLLLSGAFSLWIAAADAELANSARTAATLAHEKTHGKGGTLWFEGHWGFQYYMESLGARPLDFDNPGVQPGDFVVIPYNNIQLRSPDPRLIASQEDLVFPLHTWATTISWDLGAGFYSSYWGPLPFAIGPVPPERYTIIHMREMSRPDASGSRVQFP